MALARVFVALAYVILGVSFLASTGLLIREFQGSDWRLLIAAHSHLFFFFPVFGLVALAAFYLPSVVFTDLYWRHVRFGKVRFLGGLVALAVVSYLVGKWLDKPPRQVWEIAPQALASDRGDPAGCGPSSRTACRRGPILETLESLRAAGQARVGLSKFARVCKVDELLERPEEMSRKRHCFPANDLLDGDDCCKVQRAFADEVNRLQADPAHRSLSAYYDAAVFLPLKIFFVLLVLGIGGLLAWWRDRIDFLYREKIPAVERGVIIGAAAMLIWPMMDYGYQQTANVLYGRWEAGPQLRLSLVIAPWALLLLFYFLRRLGKRGELIGQTAGVVTAGVAVLRYEDLNDWAVHLVGIGSRDWIVAGLLIFALLLIVALVWPWRSHFVPPPGPAAAQPRDVRAD
ncbi:MAG TPA: hypothetical protein VJ740_09000 [Hyphomicrobiaceae bacterium]|nr:hypothetical protein [Hyphomicrobiaceae bacterium]